MVKRANSIQQPQPVTQVDPSSLPSFSPSLCLPWPQKSRLWTGRHRRRSRCPGGAAGMMGWIHLRFLRWTTKNRQFSLEFQRFWYGCVQKLMGKIHESSSFSSFWRSIAGALQGYETLRFFTARCFQVWWGWLVTCSLHTMSAHKPGTGWLETHLHLLHPPCWCLGNRFHIFHPHLMVRVLVASSSNRFLKLWQDWGRLTGMMPAGPEGWWPRHPNQPNRHSLLFQMLAETRPRLPWQLRDAKSTVNGCGGLPHGFLRSLNHSHWWAAARIGYPSKNLGARSPQQARLVLHDNNLQGIRRFQTHFESIC